MNYSLIQLNTKILQYEFFVLSVYEVNESIVIVITKSGSAIHGCFDSFP
jgi:hypothetical protein